MQSETQPEGQSTFIEEVRRAQIIDAAIDTIVERGYAGASLAAIARRARISKGALLYYFAGREGLIRAVVDHIFSAIDAFMRSRIESESTAWGALEAYITSNIAFMRDHPGHMVALVEILMGYRGSDGRPLFAFSDADAVLIEIQQILEAGQRNGEFRDFSPYVMATAIRGAIDAIPPRLASPGLDVEGFRTELVDLFRRAILETE